MLTAHLYIRVSTDEQAIKGYSQRSQADRLTNYCKQNQISIAGAIFEDCSAKTFNRPEWCRLYAKLRSSKNKSPIILFTHWDCFSRNITDAYHMLEKLKKMGVLFQAIDQPIDFSVPESKIMLAMYLATSEVENDKRSRNVSLGMRKAMLEGRWINKAPIGYQNRVAADGQKYISSHEPEATIIAEIFESIVRQGIGDLSGIYKDAVAKGLHCSRGNFYHLIKSPIYCGKIVVPPNEQEKGRTVEGLHRGIISELLFERVQKMLGKLRSIPKKNKRPISEKFILRGVLLCPYCGKTLTASTSQGKRKKYDYYHCLKGCRYRIGAEYVNSKFLDFLKNLKADEYFAGLNADILKKTCSKKQSDYHNKKLLIGREMKRLIDRSLNAQQLFSKGEIDYDDYLLIRDNCKRSLNSYANQLKEHAMDFAAGTHTANRKYALLDHLAECYTVSDTATKQKIVRLFFPEKAVLDSDVISNMVPETIRAVFGLRSIENNENQNERRINRDSEEIRCFLREVVSLDIENTYRQF